MQFSELIKYVASIHNKKDLIISFNQEQIIITTIPINNSFYIVKENKTNIINKIIPNHSIISLVKLSKMIKLENYEIKVEEFNNKFTLNLIQNTSSFTFDLVRDTDFFCSALANSSELSGSAATLVSTFLPAANLTRPFNIFNTY
jgi:hypothetical protein